MNDLEKKDPELYALMTKEVRDPWHSSKIQQHLDRRSWEYQLLQHRNRFMKLLNMGSE